MKRKNLYYAFFIPIIIYSLYNIFFNNNVNFISYIPDTTNQYIPLFKYLKGILMFENNFFYSFSKGIGGSMFLTFFYYLSSPLNIFLSFFKNINLFLNILATIKIGLCGLTMCIFLNHKDKADNKINFVFSTCYALMGYNICYIGNIFWIDVVYIAPIVLLGIDKIFENNDSRLFIISLMYSLICNFYLSCSLLIFCFIYFLYNYFYYNCYNKKKQIKIFLIAILLCIGICSIFLIPVGLELMQFGYRTNMHSIINSDYQNIYLLFYKHLIGSSDVNFNQYMFVNAPNLYCSLFVFIFYLNFLFDKSVPQKNKIYIILINLFLVLSMILEPLYLAWHGFSNTNGNPYRFSYLWCLFEILIAHKAYLHFTTDYKINKKIYIILFIFVYFNIILFFSNCVFYNKGLEIFLTSFFLILYIVIFKIKKIRCYIYLIVIIEIITNLIVSGDFKNFFENQICEEGIKYSDRILTTNINESLYCNYGSSTFYLSTINPYITNFLSSSGSHAYNIFSYSYYDSILINYLLGIQTKYHEEAVLSYGYMVYDNDFLYNNSIEFQEGLLNSMINEKYKYYFESSIDCNEELTCKFFDDKGNKYLLLNYKRYNVGKIFVNNERISKNIFPVFNHLIRLDNLKNGDNILKIELFCDLNDSNCTFLDIKIYDFDISNFEHAISILKEQQLNVTKMEKNRLEGNINVTKDNQYLFLSIPYEKGWNIYIDGKKTKYEKIYDAFIGIKLDKGYHEIKMVFYPYGLNIGIIISSISVAILIIYFVITKKR